MDIEWGKDGDDRQALYLAGAAGDGAKPRRTDHSALHSEGPLDPAGERPQHRPAHRRGPRARHPRREGNVPRAGGRRARRRHDRSGLGAGDEARRRHRHQSRRPHLPCGHHCARTRHSGGGRLRHRDQRDTRKSGGHRLVRRRRHRTCLRRNAGIRSAAHRTRFAAGDPGQNHDEYRQPRPGLRVRRLAAQGRRSRAARIHHQSHDRRASARAAGIRQAKPRAQGDHRPADRGLRGSGELLCRQTRRRHRTDRRRIRARTGHRASFGFQIERVRELDRRQELRAARRESDARFSRCGALHRQGLPALLRARMPRSEARAR